MSKFPYILKTKSFRSRNEAVTDLSHEEGTTSVYTFTQGIYLPGRREDLKAWNKETLVDPKDHNIVFGCSLPVEDLLEWDMLPKSHYDAPLVKKDILDLLSTICPDDFQAFPVKIRTSLPETKDLSWDMKNPAYWTNPICEDFFIINITHWADILDHRKAWISGVDKNNTFLRAHNTVFREDSSLLPHHIARIKFYDTKIAVSPELAQAMKKAGFKGPKFVRWTDIPQYRDPPEEWKGKCPCPKCEEERKTRKKGWFWW